MRQSINVFLLSLFSVLALLPIASASTPYIVTDTESLLAALEHASSEQEVNLMPGVYVMPRHPILIDAKSGSAERRIVLRAAEAFTVQLKWFDDRSEGDYIRVRGLK